MTTATVTGVVVPGSATRLCGVYVMSGNRSSFPVRTTRAPLFPGSAVAGRICTGTADDVSFVIQKTPCVVRPGTTVTGVATGSHDTVRPTAVALDALGGTAFGGTAFGGTAFGGTAFDGTVDVVAPARAIGPSPTARAAAATTDRRRTAERGWVGLSTSSSLSTPG